MPATIFSGQKIKTLKDTLTLNGKSDIISSMDDPTASAVDAPIGSLLINQTSGKLYRKLDAGSSVNWEEVGAGVGGINYILNPSAEVNTTGWATYADAAGTAPVDGSGGSPNVTWTRSTTSPLRGVADFNFAKDAANRQGQGVSYDFTIDDADKAKVLAVTFDYEVLSGTYADGDLTVYLIADPTGTPVVIQPAGYTVQSATVGTTMREVATFQTQATGTSYRLCFHVASTSASAYTLAIDNVVVGPQSVVYGSPVTDWVSYTPVMTGGTASSISGRWRRVGDSIHARVVATLSSSGVYQITVPFPVDSSKFPNNAINIIYGMAVYGDTSANVSYTGGAYFTSTTTVRFYGPANTEWSAVTPVAFGVGDGISLDIVYPAAGLSSSVQMSQDTDTRVVAASGWNNSATSITASTTVSKVTTFGAALHDTHSAWSSINQEYLVPVSGYYSVFFSLFGQAVPSLVQLSALIRRNGGTIAEGTERNYGATPDSVNPRAQIIRFFSAGDTISFWTATTSSTATVGSFNPTSFSIQRLSGPATIAASETVGCSYDSLAAGTVAPAGTDLIYTNKIFDTHNTFNTSNGEYTVPVSGKYTISGQYRTITTAMSIGFGTALSVKIDNVVAKFIANVRTQTTSGIIREVSGAPVTLNLLAGQKIKLHAFSDTSATIDTTNNALFNWVSIMRTGN